MTGIVGLGQRAMAGRQGPAAQEKAAAFDRFGLQVTPANVLGIYAVVKEEATRLQSSIQDFQADHLEGMPRLGDDPVSEPASRGFTEATNQMLLKCQADVDDLQSLAAGIAAAAKEYGNSEEQIRASFDPLTYQYRPEPVHKAAGGGLPRGHVRWAVPCLTGRRCRSHLRTPPAVVRGEPPRGTRTCRDGRGRDRARPGRMRRGRRVPEPTGVVGARRR